MQPPKTERTARRADRRSTGAWYTPEHLVDMMVARTVSADWVARFDRPIRILDPACGDGRFLAAASRAVRDAGGQPITTGVDIDAAALEVARAHPELVSGDHHCDDALGRVWVPDSFDLVIGNPPFLSQLATATSRGGASRYGGGPYADAAAEFLALAVEVAAPGGRVALVLPQSILASRDADHVRAEVDRSTTLLWSWWSPERHFEAEVIVCALGVERLADATAGSTTGAAPGSSATWTSVVLDELGIPSLPPLDATGRLGDRAMLRANFRDEYYALTGAIATDDEGAPLVTSGLIDPGRCWWGRRPVRFAKRLHDAPRIDIGRLDERMQRWAAGKLVPKVLIANQTRIVEAVADRSGEWLPGVPVTSATPIGDPDPRPIAAVLTSPVASAWVWAQAAGTGLSARSIRLGPHLIADLPWPAGDLGAAVAALDRDDVVGCGDEVCRAYGLDPEATGVRRLIDWWSSELDRLRAAAPRGAHDGRADRAPANR